MRIVFFYPSLLSDLNNPSATGLRGLGMELLLRGHEVIVYEPLDGRPLQAVLAAYGHGPVARFHAAYPGLASRRYSPATLDLPAAVAGASLVVAHATTDPGLLAGLQALRARCGDFHLVLHAPRPTPARGFDAVRCADGATGPRSPGAGAVFIPWSAAADTRIFRPPAPSPTPELDVICVAGSAAPAQLDALAEFCLRPAQRLGLRARVYGAGLAALAPAEVQLAGWVPDFDLPRHFAAARVAVVLPSSVAGRPDPYLFPALACGRPVLAGPWSDTNHLLHPGRDYLVARDGAELTGWLARLLADPQLAATLADSGHRAVLAHHTMARRADTLLGLTRSLPAARLNRVPVVQPTLSAPGYVLH